MLLLKYMSSSESKGGASNSSPVSEAGRKLQVCTGGYNSRACLWQVTITSLEPELRIYSSSILCHDGPDIATKRFLLQVVRIVRIHWL